MSKTLDRLTLLNTFVQIADAGSISAAARLLNQTQPTTSRQLQDLEQRLGVQLMRRNTHSLALTESGIQLLSDARELLDGWEALEDKHSGEDSAIQGAIKIVAPVALGQQQLARIACEFQSLYPGVSLNWVLEDEAIRFSEIGCDCWIKVGPIADDNLIVKNLGSVERLLVASPKYLQTRPPIKTPKALNNESFVALQPFEGAHLQLADSKGNQLQLTPPVRMTTNNIFSLREAVLTGLGTGVLPAWFISSELKSGRLVDLFPRWRARRLSINLAYLPARHQPRRLRAFLDHLIAQIPRIPGIEPSRL